MTTQTTDRTTSRSSSPSIQMSPSLNPCRKKVSWLISACSLLVFSGWAHAQVLTTPSQPNSTPRSASQANPSAAPQAQPASDPSPFGEEIPLIDLANDTITLAGVEFPIDNTRLVKARFEKYLNQPSEEQLEAEQYHEKIDQILFTLGPLNQKPTALGDAVRLLPETSTFRGDARLSETLMSSIYSAILVRRDGASLQEINRALEAEREELIEREEWNRKIKENSITERNRRRLEAQQNGATQAGDSERADQASNLRIQETRRRIAEIEKLRLENDLRGEIAPFEAKVNYQANMVAWLAQRRFDHVLMASRFYPRVWTSGDDRLRAEEEAKLPSEIKNSVGFSPTITGLESIANEAILDTERAVDAVKNSMSLGDLHTASKRLLEAFAVGEFLSPVTTFPIEQKRKIQIYVRNLDELYQAVNARDYGRASELVLALQKQANDFPASKARSAIAGYTRMSDLKISQAIAYMRQGEGELSSQSLEQGLMVWPLNPMYEDYLQAANKLQGIDVQVDDLLNDFDRLIREKNYRLIAERRAEFIPVVANDPVRQQQLNELETNLQKIEMALFAAEQFTRSNQYYAAWESLSELREDFPNDPKLGTQMEVLAPQVADFTRAIQEAKDLENQRNPQTGSAIAFYLRARAIYPQSKTVDDALNRLSERVFASQ